MALGSAIVDEMRLDARGEVLQRWMAHYLAETIYAAETSTGVKKAKLEGHAVALILKLWAHRRALPEPVDPLSGCREAVQVLKRLQPEANPWLRRSNERPGETHLSHIFDAMSRAMLGSIALTQLKVVAAPAAEFAEHLDPDEIALLKAFEQWLPYVDRTPRLAMSQKENESGLVTISMTEEPDPVEAVFAEPKDESRLRAMVALNLRTVHSSLGKLIDQWDAPQKPTIPGIDDA